MNRHQRKPNRWSCSITTLAMALHLPVERIVEEAEHDGSEIIFPHLAEPMNRRGFHSQELVRIAWQYGFSMTPIELFPRTQSTDGQHVYLVGDKIDRHARFITSVNASCGILEGKGHRCQHAVYNQYGQIFDPDHNVPIYNFSFANCESRSFYANRLWIIRRIEA